MPSPAVAVSLEKEYGSGPSPLNVVGPESEGSASSGFSSRSSTPSCAVRRRGPTRASCVPTATPAPAHAIKPIGSFGSALECKDECSTRASSQAATPRCSLAQAAMGALRGSPPAPAASVKPCYSLPLAALEERSQSRASSINGRESLTPNWSTSALPQRLPVTPCSARATATPRRTSRPILSVSPTRRNLFPSAEIGESPVKCSDFRLSRSASTVSTASTTPSRSTASCFSTASTESTPFYRKALPTPLSRTTSTMSLGMPMATAAAAEARKRRHETRRASVETPVVKKEIDRTPSKPSVSSQSALRAGSKQSEAEPVVANGFSFVERAFSVFKGTREGLDYQSFVRFCECVSASGSSGRPLTRDEAKLMFTKLMPKGKELMDITEFRVALTMMADAKFRHNAPVATPRRVETAEGQS